MVYTISDKVVDRTKEEMDTRFQKVQNEENTSSAIEYQPKEKWRIWKNILVIGVAFMIHFTAFFGAANLQSSVNADEGLGTSSLASIYGALIISNVLLPAMIIRWFGCKWTIAVSFLTYTPFIMAQFYPKFYTLIPGGLLVGFGGGPLWCAKCTYLTVISEAYEKVSDVTANVIVIKFYGVFFMLFQLSQVWGNLISAEILSSGDDHNERSLQLDENETIKLNTTELFLQNLTKTIEEEDDINIGDICGANFCPASIKAANPNLTPPPAYKINLISGIYLGCMILAFLIVALGVDSLKRYNRGRKTSTEGISGFKMLAVTLKHLGNPLQILLLPITMFIGAEQAFITADFNAAFVSCGWGISNIGFVMMCYGITNAIAAILIGTISKITGRNPIIIFALILHVALMIVLLNWKPNGINTYTYFIVVGLWGVADAIWLVQINSLSGILFPGSEEAAYSNFRLWESTGSVLTYIYSPYLCADIKIYILLTILIVGVIGYAAIQVIKAKKVNENDENATKGKFVLVDKKSSSGEVAD